MKSTNNKPLGSGLPSYPEQGFGPARVISANSRLWLVLSNALDASKNAENTGVLLFTYYESLSKNMHMPVPCCGLKTNRLSVVVTNSEMHDKMLKLFGDGTCKK